MPKFSVTLPALLVLVAATGLGADVGGDALGGGLQAVRSMAGCYLVDYSYVEVQDLKPGYVRDPRVYDVNRDKSAKEWITAETLSPTRVRLQLRGVEVVTVVPSRIGLRQSCVDRRIVASS